MADLPPLVEIEREINLVCGQNPKYLVLPFFAGSWNLGQVLLGSNQLVGLGLDGLV